MYARDYEWRIDFWRMVGLMACCVGGMNFDKCQTSS
jgi:hypothetical protein